MADEAAVNPFENLSRDHVQITLALDAIDSAIVAAARGEFDLPRFERMVEFIELWADGAHYAKEERLFAELEGHGLPRAVGPTAFLELEHQATRDHALRMRQAISAIGAGQPDEGVALIDALARYTAILRIHMPKEDLGYFRMSAAMLGQPAVDRLGDAFEIIDAGLPATFEQVARALAPRSAAQVNAPAQAPASWHQAQDRHLRQIVRTLNLEGEGVGSPLRVTRRRRLS